ncbi:MAG: hypothetical protein JSS53_07200 [Proteobacteria bacterium]|nr:hypothetical protein [Pseudomonadota bacterium]
MPPHHFVNSIIIILFTTFFIFLSFLKKIRYSDTWKATVTPLASIIGSGFLVVTPLFILILGKYALFATAGMVSLAYIMGYIIRFNISYLEPQMVESRASGLIAGLEHISYPMLGLAYLISVPFYIKLLSLFILRSINSKDELIANSIATLILGFIGIVGKFRGFKKLEFLEEYAVNFKLSIIFSMIIGLIIYNLNLVNTHSWQLAITTPKFGMEAIRQLLGTIIIVQGFETSRFLGLTYNASMRVKTMRYAQIISGIIYVVFVGLSLVAFNTIHSINETSIIDISAKVAIVLPYILIIAAILSQFSAAIADTVSAGGLFSEASSKRLKPNNNYLMLSIIAIGLTWSTNIFEIITLASRAFAIYYALQALEATLLVYQKIKNIFSILQTILFFLMTCIMIMVAVFGISV